MYYHISVKINATGSSVAKIFYDDNYVVVGIQYFYENKWRDDKKSAEGIIPENSDIKHLFGNLEKKLKFGKFNLVHQGWREYFSA